MVRPGAMMMAATVAVVVCAAVAPAQSDREALARFELLNLGDYQMRQQQAPPPSASDAALCLRYLVSDDDELRGAACLALTAIVDRPFYRELPAATRTAIDEELLPLLEHGHDDTAEWSGRAVRRLARAGLLSKKVRRTAAIGAMTGVSADDPERRRRAAWLLTDLVPGLPPQLVPDVARHLLLGLERHHDRRGPRDRVAASTMRHALMQLDVRDPKLSAELAQLVLRDLEHGVFERPYDRSDAVRSLGRHMGALRGEHRAAALERLREALCDRQLLYMTTSGVRSPLRHAGGEAVAAAWPSLRAEERETLRATITECKERWSGMDERDRESVFGPLELLK